MGCSRAWPGRGGVGHRVLGGGTGRVNLLRLAAFTDLVDLEIDDLAGRGRVVGPAAQRAAEGAAVGFHQDFAAADFAFRTLALNQELARFADGEAGLAFFGGNELAAVGEEGGGGTQKVLCLLTE